MSATPIRSGLEIVPARIFIGLLGRPLGLNVERQGNRWGRAAAVSVWRVGAAEAWTDLGPPRRLSPVVVHIEPHYQNNASRPDTGSCIPTAKAAIDGLVDAGAIPDDSPDWVKGLHFHAPMMLSDRGDGLLLWLETWTEPR